MKNIVFVIILIFVAITAFFIGKSYGQSIPQLYKGMTAKEVGEQWDIRLNQANQEQIQIATLQGKINSLETQPTPSTVVKYQTPITQPTDPQSSINPDLSQVVILHTCGGGAIPVTRADLPKYGYPTNYIPASNFEESPACTGK